MNRLQEKLDFLLEKYSVDICAVLKNDKIVIINGVELPIFAHRCERRFTELKNIVNNGTLYGISVMRTARITHKGADIYDELCRELDICQYILQRKIKSITVMENGNVLNAVADAEDGVVCTIEISAVLNLNESPKDKHEIISQRGTACDVAADVQLKQNSIYFFGNENREYTDVDFELYGLTAEETAVVRGAFAIAKNKNYDEIKTADAELSRLMELAKRSAQTGEREVM